VVTSVVVSWSIALWKGERIGAKAAAICVVKPDALLTLNEAAGPGRRARMIWYIDSIGKTNDDERAAKQKAWEIARDSGERHRWPDSWLAWGDLDRPQLELVRRRQSAFGFPAVCLWYERSGGLSMFGSAPRLHGGYEITTERGRKRSGMVAEAAIPLRPIWAGLAMNTAVYASCWIGVLGLLAAWRRARAGRHGRCRSCGYDLGGLPAGAVCPECGTCGVRGTA
jgi:hypothetical protein